MTPEMKRIIENIPVIPAPRSSVTDENIITYLIKNRGGICIYRNGEPFYWIAPSLKKCVDVLLEQIDSNISSNRLALGQTDGFLNKKDTIQRLAFRIYDCEKYFKPIEDNGSGFNNSSFSCLTEDEKIALLRSILQFENDILTQLYARLEALK